MTELPTTSATNRKPEGQSRLSDFLSSSAPSKFCTIVMIVVASPFFLFLALDILIGSACGCYKKDRDDDEEDGVDHSIDANKDIESTGSVAGATKATDENDEDDASHSSRSGNGTRNHEDKAHAMAAPPVDSVDVFTPHATDTSHDGDDGERRWNNGETDTDIEAPMPVAAGES